MSFLNDTLLFFKKIKYIQYLGKSNKDDQEILDILNRNCIRQPKKTWLYTLYQFLVPRIRLHDHIPLEIPSSSSFINNNDNNTIFYINGVRLSQAACVNHVHILSEVLKHNVTGLYNPTNGFLIDCLESIFGRSFNVREPITKAFEKIIREQLINSNNQVVLVAHSQGAIIVSNIVHRLKKHIEAKKHLHKLRVYTFGSGADEMPELPYPPVHFANTYDFIAQIGVIGCESSTSGIVIKKDRFGHSFAKNYLVGFLQGEYGKDNSLYQQFRKK